MARFRSPVLIGARTLISLFRRILLFPGGNNVQQLSVYLDVADSATLPQGWTRHAHFTLTVHNQKDATRNVVKGAQPSSEALICPAALGALSGAREILLHLLFQNRVGGVTSPERYVEHIGPHPASPHMTCCHDQMRIISSVCVLAIGASGSS